MVDEHLDCTSRMTQAIADSGRWTSNLPWEDLGGGRAASFCVRHDGEKIYVSYRYGRGSYSEVSEGMVRDKRRYRETDWVR